MTYFTCVNSLNTEYEVVVSPSSPTYYQYTFEPGVKRWHTLFVESEGDSGEYCAYVSVQPAKVQCYSNIIINSMLCPAYCSFHSSQTTSLYIHLCMIIM